MCIRDREYAMAVQQRGHTLRPEPALMIPSSDPWLDQLHSAGHLIPFECHAAADATTLARANANWSLTCDASLARGVDARLFYDSLSFKVLAAVSFGPAACLSAEESMGQLAGQADARAVTSVLHGIAEEACKVKAAPAHIIRTFTLRSKGAVIEGIVHRVEAQVTSVLGPMVEVNCVMLGASEAVVCELVATFEQLN
eukprot:TRINITY_DN13410_c0_g1_i5.p1 TRINITY_DN13410_c0_g1~~TRINITY_DN13410_c0_g1_i5.p1  ORF type:complete len:198 (-),score=45.68 TRINITY_DN13410_c0_g1_i5:35-628(-)